MKLEIDDYYYFMVRNLLEELDKPSDKANIIERIELLIQEGIIGSKETYKGGN